MAKAKIRNRYVLLATDNREISRHATLAAAEGRARREGLQPGKAEIQDVAAATGATWLWRLVKDNEGVAFFPVAS